MGFTFKSKQAYEICVQSFSMKKHAQKACGICSNMFNQKAVDHNPGSQNTFGNHKRYELQPVTHQDWKQIHPADNWVTFL
jgi:hypothetical protein